MTRTGMCLLLVLTSSARAQFGQGGAGGILIDPQGVLRAVDRLPIAKTTPVPGPEEPVARFAEFRQVSLIDLDRELRRHLEDGMPIPPEVEFLAGLVKIELVLVDRQQRDVLLVGPAEGWRPTRDGRLLGIRSKRPVLRLEDLAQALRCVLFGTGEASCSIEPTAAGLAAVRRVTYPTEFDAGVVAAFHRELADRLGMQNVITAGIDQGSHFARVMVEADYRMKRMALGKEKVPGLHSHLDTLAELTARGEERDSLARWWFTPRYEAVLTNEDKTVFQFTGQGVQLQNEEVVFDAAGRRRGLGASNPDWDKFSSSFTKNFPDLERRFPIYAELHNLFDLMMVAGLIRQQGLAEWLADTALVDSSAYRPPAATHPVKAEPVIASRTHKGKLDGEARRFFTFTFGGVSVRPADILGGEMVKADGVALAEKVAPAIVDQLLAARAASNDQKPPAKSGAETAPSPATKPIWWADVKMAKPASP